MNNERTIGYIVDNECLVCLSCGYANKDAQHIEPAYNTGYPDGFTCAQCCEVIAP